MQITVQRSLPLALALVASLGACSTPPDEVGSAADDLAAGRGDAAPVAGADAAPFEGRAFGDAKAVAKGGKLIARVSGLINAAASSFERGEPGVAADIADAAAELYTPDASIFAALIAAGALPPGEGPAFLAGALAGLDSQGQTLHVVRVCDVVGVPRRGEGELSVVFTNVARRGPPGQPELLATERFDAVKRAGRWVIASHDFVRPEVSNVSACDSAAARDALAAVCAGLGVACAEGDALP